MSCEVAAFPFQLHANYGTWSIDFDCDSIKLSFFQQLILQYSSSVLEALAKRLPLFFVIAFKSDKYTVKNNFDDKLF